MKILVFSHQLEMGGGLVNAIELAATLRDIHGHEIVFFATPGPMLKLVEEKCLRFIPAPAVQSHPSPMRMRMLREVVQREHPDLIHAWEWYQCLDAYYVEHLLKRVPLVVTAMVMGVPRLLPKALPITFGTPELVDQATAAGYRRVGLLVPPVDVTQNAPGAIDPQSFRVEYGIKQGDITLVTVSRLNKYMKGESLRRTIDVVRRLGRELPLRFIIVGDGDADAELKRLARETNSELGRTAIVLTGALLDPRPAYAAADIFIGMGGSALRAMAFGKPVVIVGARGFSVPFTPETAEAFYYKGIYGVGDGSSDNTRLIRAILEFAKHPNQILALGEFSRQFVIEHFGLEKVSAKFSEFCHFAVAHQPRLHIAVADGLRTATIWIRERRWVSHGC